MSTSHESPRDPEDRSRYSTEPAAEKPARPSVLQTLAGALTAITVTYLMSFLGVAGTIIGVGLVSVLTVLGNFMYSSAIYSAKEKVKQAQPKARKRAERPEQTVAPAGSTSSESTEVEGTSPATDAAGRREPGHAYPDSPDGSSSPGRWRRVWTTMRQRYGRGKIFGSIALVFALLAGTITVIELGVGQPLSDIVRNEDSSGTTFFGGADADDDGAETEDDGAEEVPPPEDDVEGPQAPEVPQEGEMGEPEEPQDQGPAEEPQQEEQQPAPEDGALGQ